MLAQLRCTRGFNPDRVQCSMSSEWAVRFLGGVEGGASLRGCGPISYRASPGDFGRVGLA